MRWLEVRHEVFKLDRPAISDLNAKVFLQLRLIHRFVHQHVGPFCHYRDRFGRSSVPGEHYRTILEVKTVESWHHRRRSRLAENGLAFHPRKLNRIFTEVDRKSVV